MAMLALGSYWLLRSTPPAPEPVAERPLLHDPSDVMRRAAFACAPPQAQAEVRAVAHHVTAAAGGAGAARELCDLLLVASGRYAGLLAAHGA